MRTLGLALALAVAAGLALGGCNSLFFQPNRILYYLPERFDLAAEDVFFDSTDGTPLTAWFLPARGTPRGTIVYFHGNGANISNHLAFVRWLPPAGYAVFLFDYRGYGVSGGEPSRAGVIQDGIAALAWVRARPDVDAQRLVVFAQSLGGAVAIGALARSGTQGVRALVIEGGFGSYREEARRFMNEHWFTWPFQYPAAWLLVSDELRPFDDLPRLAGVPLLLIASTGDRTVPIANGRDLYAAFPGADKTFWEVPELPHVLTFLPTDSPWRARLLRYLDEKLGPPAAAPAASPSPG